MVRQIDLRSRVEWQNVILNDCPIRVLVIPAIRHNDYRRLDRLLELRDGTCRRPVVVRIVVCRDDVIERGQNAVTLSAGQELADRVDSSTTVTSVNEHSMAVRRDQQGGAANAWTQNTARQANKAHR